MRQSKGQVLRAKRQEEFQAWCDAWQQFWLVYDPARDDNPDSPPPTFIRDQTILERGPDRVARI